MSWVDIYQAHPAIYDNLTGEISCGRCNGLASFLGELA